MLVDILVLSTLGRLSNSIPSGFIVLTVLTNSDIYLSPWMHSLVGLFSAINAYGSNPAGVLLTFRKLNKLIRLRPFIDFSWTDGLKFFYVVDLFTINYKMIKIKLVGRNDIEWTNYDILNDTF